ncbi:hypothetical protein Tco_0210517 [Tanacetum coccineum]
MKNFLWSHGSSNGGKAKIAWKVVCRPKDQSGLGIKPLREWNEVLLMKHIWKIVEQKQNLWVQWVNRVKLKGRNIWDIEINDNDSWGWKMLMGLRDKRDIYDARLNSNNRVADLIDKARWKWPSEWIDMFPILKDIQVPSLNDSPDKANERNSRAFKNGSRDEETVIKIVKDEIRGKLASLNVKRSVVVKRVFERE